MDLSLVSELNSGGQPEIVGWSRLWTINNFSYHCSDNREIRSTTFSKDEVEWYFSLKFVTVTNQYNSNEKHLKMHFNVVSNARKLETSAQCQFSILNSTDEKAFTFGQFDGSKSLYPNYFNFKISRLFEKCDELLPDDKLRIYCEVSVCDLSDYHVKVPRSQLSDDYRLLFDNENFSDVILSSEGTDFQAHKIILSARSSVFRAMFEHEMKESKHNRVEISDINSEVMREVLRFIYTDEVIDLQNMAADLLVAADKYALLRLKAMCEKELCSKKFLIENALKLLMLADRHDATQLKTKAIGFLKMHLTKVMETPGWKDVVQLPHLIEELLCA